MAKSRESRTSNDVHAPYRKQEQARPGTARRRPVRPGAAGTPPTDDRAGAGAEESLRGAEQRFRAIFDNTSDGIFVLDWDTRKFTMCNQSCLQMLGYTQEEFLRLSIADLHAPDDLPFVDTQIERLLQGAQPAGHDVRFRRKDGSIVFTDLSPRLLVLEGRRYILVALKDMTERKRLEEELRQYAEHLEELVAARTGELQESEARYRSLYHTVADGIFVMGADGRIADVNDSVCAQLGYTRAELVGMPVSAVSARPDFNLGEILDRLRAAGSLSYETTHRRKDGTTVPVELSITLVEYRGQPAILGVARDVTERKRAEEALRQSEEKFAKAFRSSPIAISVTRLSDGRIVEVNEAMLRLLHFNRDEVMGRTTLGLGIWADVADRAECIRRLRCDGSARDLECRLRTRDGDIVTVQLSAELLEFGGEPYMLTTLVDVTARKQMEEALQFTQFAIDHTADAAFWMTEEGRFFYVNEAACQALGYSRDELLQMTIYDINPVFTEDMWSETWRKLKAQKSGILETVHRAKDGRVYPVEIRGNYLESGGRAYDCAFARDITERKQTETALRESEQRYRRLVENLKGSHFVYQHDTMGIFTYVSESVTQVLGYTLDEGLPHYSKYFTDHPANQAAYQYTELTLQGIRQPPYEVNVWHKDGSTRWLEVQEVPVYDAHGRVVAVEGVAQDITERKRAQEALVESEDRYRILLEHGFDGIFVHEDFRIVQLNDRLAEMTGYTRAELLGAPALNLFTPAAQERIREYAGSGATGYFEIELCRRDGRLVDIEAYGAACQFQGRPARIVGLRDITERKQAEEALQFTQFAVDRMADAAFWMTEDARFVYVNEAACQALGYSRDELLQMTVYDIDPSFTESMWRDSWRRLKAEKSRVFETVHRTRDGRVFPVEIRANYLEFGGREYHCAFARDITKRKQAEEALRRWNEQLELQVAQRTEDLRRTVGRLRQLTLELSQAEDRERKRIADILHEDVQQTLAAARFHLNLLGSENRTAQESRKIVAQVKQMLRDAIERSRSLSHELSPALYQVELLEILNWLARHMRQEHGLTVRVEAHGQVDSPSEPLKAFLYKVVQELLFNVIKHAGVSEAVVRARRVGRSIHLSVVDQGRGFDPQKLEGAAGFGLLGIRERVQLLGGRMKIRSTLGRGSRILIAVPDQGTSAAVLPAEYGHEQA